MSAPDSRTFSLKEKTCQVGKLLYGEGWVCCMVRVGVSYGEVLCVFYDEAFSLKKEAEQMRG